MKVITAEPLTMAQMIELSKTGDALITVGEFKCRYMRTAASQEIEVDVVGYDRETGIRWGLRRVEKPQYKYLAFKIQ